LASHGDKLAGQSAALPSHSAAKHETTIVVTKPSSVSTATLRRHYSVYWKPANAMTKKRGREDPSEALASQPVSLPKRSKAAAKLVSEISSDSQATSNGVAIKGTEDATSKEGEEEEEEEEEDDDDYTSSSGTSSPSSSSDEEDQSDEDTGEKDTKHGDEDAITYVPGRPKPKIQRTNPLGHSGLMSRISSFLPQLQAANVDLEQKLAIGDTKDIIMDDARDDEEQYIEMVSLFETTYAVFFFLFPLYSVDMLNKV
jgi:hypothetical protein